MKQSFNNAYPTPPPAAQEPIDSKFGFSRMSSVQRPNTSPGPNPRESSFKPVFQENIIKIVYLRKEKKGNYVFKVLPDEREITRSINDIYSLRQSLVMEFPFYYV